MGFSRTSNGGHPMLMTTNTNDRLRRFADAIAGPHGSSAMTVMYCIHPVDDSKRTFAYIVHYVSTPTQLFDLFIDKAASVPTHVQHGESKCFTAPHGATPSRIKKSDIPANCLRCMQQLLVPVVRGERARHPASGSQTPMVVPRPHESWLRQWQ